MRAMHDDAVELNERCRILERENSYYKALINDMITAVIEVNRDGILVNVNKCAAWYLGGTPGDIIGKSMRDLFPDEETEFVELYRKVIDTLVPAIFDRQIRFRTGKRWLRAIVYPVFAPGHAERLAQVEAIDITEEKTFQEELLATERRRIELESCLRKAQKIDAIGTLAGGIAHDFNNILSAIIGYTELVLLDTERDTLNYQNLHEVLAAGMRAKALIGQILTFSRQAEQQMLPVQLSGIVREVGRMLKSTMPSTIEFKFNNNTRNSTIFGDATQIHQVVLNLCTNSVYAMEQKGGPLTIDLDTVTFSQDTAPFADMDISHPFVELTVTDAGGGISPEVIDRIFEPYVTTKPSGEGTGLGLSVVHGIVRSHKGHINVESRPGDGTTISIYLPLLQKQDQDQIAPEHQIPGGSEHILLVDDEPQIVHMYRQALERLGYTVSTRTSSLEALEAFKSQPSRFDAVITDMTMPNLTGDRLAQQVKYLGDDTPVILCTGYGEKISRQKSKNMGIDLLLMKPVGWADLAGALRMLLDSKKKV